MAFIHAGWRCEGFSSRLFFDIASLNVQLFMPAPLFFLLKSQSVVQAPHKHQTLKIATYYGLLSKRAVRFALKKMQHGEFIIYAASAADL